MTQPEDFVSVVIVFLNEERFLEQAVASVFAQTYSHWELLLCDDGSVDASPGIARQYAARFPDRVRYLDHPGHQNRGASATRNLGVAAARGEWVAFLDGDDVWMPNRLERTVHLARVHSEADMVYGKTEYWHSWQGSGTAADHVQSHFFRADRLLARPELLIRHLTLRAALPCMGSLLVRRSAFLSVGGFDESFRGLVDDAVFLGKFCLHHAVYVSEECWDRYRQHPGSDTAVAEVNGTLRAARRAYLAWLAEYVDAHEISDTRVLNALRGAQARQDRSSRHWRSRLERAARRAARLLWSWPGRFSRRRWLSDSADESSRA